MVIFALEFSIALNIVLLVLLGSYYYPWIKDKFFRPIVLPVRIETHYAVLEATKPICPHCSKEITGKLKRSITGHWCCTSCFATKFNNQ